MNEQNLSQWFDLAEQKPWEVGVYGVTITTKLWKREDHFAFWNGEEFRSSSTCPDVARQWQVPEASGITVIKWRGLSTNPEVKKKPQNKRRTMYVVMNAVTNNPAASFFNVEVARDYAENVNFPVRVRKIRFRTPE